MNASAKDFVKKATQSDEINWRKISFKMKLAKIFKLNQFSRNIFLQQVI